MLCLCTHITAEDDALIPTEPRLLSPLLSILSDGGHLLYLPNKEDFEAGWVIIDRQALLSEINGTIFAPDNFKQHHDIATSTGVVPYHCSNLQYKMLPSWGGPSFQ